MIYVSLGSRFTVLFCTKSPCQLYERSQQFLLRPNRILNFKACTEALMSSSFNSHQNMNSNILFFLLFVNLGVYKSASAYKWSEGVTKCWATNQLENGRQNHQWNCLPENGLLPRRCVKFRFEGTDN